MILKNVGDIVFTDFKYRYNQFHLFAILESIQTYTNIIIYVMGEIYKRVKRSKHFIEIREGSSIFKLFKFGRCE